MGHFEKNAVFFAKIILNFFSNKENKKYRNQIDSGTFWRRVRDLNPGDAHHAYTISNRKIKYFITFKCKLS